MLKFKKTDHTILMGDFNFTEHVSDSPSPESNILIHGKELKAWSKVKDTLHLSEIEQPTHTHFFIAKQTTNNRTSRIERIYITHH